jgi:gas vesicle protein
MNNLAELDWIKNCQTQDLAEKRGFPVEWWMKSITGGGDKNRFNQLLKGEIMSDLESVIKEQTDALNELSVQWGNNLKSLKDKSEELKKDIKRHVGDVKDYVGRLKDGIDKFNATIDDKKFAEITNNIVKITECLCKISELESKGILDKIKKIL